MNKQLVPTLLAVALMASGCSFIPHLDRPAAPVAAQFPAAGQAAGEVAAADIPWRNFFTDQRLQQLIDLALENNRDLKVAVLNIEQARAQYQIQRSKQFPEVGLGANGSRAPGQENGQYTNTYMVGLSMPSWEIDFWGRIRSLKEQSLAQYLPQKKAAKPHKSAWWPLWPIPGWDYKPMKSCAPFHSAHSRPAKSQCGWPSFVSMLVSRQSWTFSRLAR